MTNKVVKRYEQWKRNVGVASPFVIICGIIAVLYFIYRIVLVVSPAISFEQSIFNPQTGSAVCHEEDDSSLKDPTPFLSNAYQTRVQKQPSLTPNLVKNADLSLADQNTGGPVYYSHSVDDNGATYQYLKQASDGTVFLRVTNTEKRPAGQTQPAWQIDPATISDKPQTYAYSFWYRSTISVHVSTEHTLPSGQTRYNDVMTLDPAPQWKQFTAHFDNLDGATSFRMDINGVDAGQIDTRGYDIHQIPDAELKEGIVSVTFDDGWQSIEDHAAPLLDKYGIKTTQYIISDFAATKTAGYMNFGTIQKLKQSGHEIGSHSLNHCNQIELPMSAVENNAVKSKQQLEDQKLGPVTTFAYPLGQYNKATQDVYQKTYPLIRSSDFGYNDRYFDETDIHSVGVLNDTKDDEFKSWLEYAKVHRVWLVLVYHRVDESGTYDVTTDQLERQLKLIKASGLKVLTMSDAASRARK